MVAENSLVLGTLLSLRVRQIIALIPNSKNVDIRFGIKPPVAIFFDNPGLFLEPTGPGSGHSNLIAR
jgi:hypothetical protein